MTAARLIHALTSFAVLLFLASPAQAGSLRCTTYEEKSLVRLQTLCDDGGRSVSTYNRTLQRREATITESPRKTCTRRLNPRTKQVEVRCR
jgi:hypothetical protein